jgi:uncharacterized RDD family membrane protein YckC
MATFDAHETHRMLTVHGLELASFSRRAAAFLLDLMFIAASFSIITSAAEPLLLKIGWIRSAEDIRFELNMNWPSIVWTVLYFGVTTYFGNGKTPGKAVVGIRVASLVHPRMSLWHSLERALGYGASLLECGFGFIQYFIHPNKRTVHDRIAETIVIRERRVKT